MWQIFHLLSSRHLGKDLSKEGHRRTVYHRTTSEKSVSDPTHHTYIWGKINKDYQNPKMLCQKKKKNHTPRHLHKMEYYSAIKKNEIKPFEATWMDLEIVILSQVSQTEKDKYYMILLIYGM